MRGAERGGRRARGQGGATPSPELRFSSCRVKSLRFHLLGQETDAVALYEQLFAHCTGVYFRYARRVRRSRRRLPAATDMIRQIGFGEERGADPATTSGCSAASISCANISPFRAAFSASTFRPRARSRRGSTPRRSTSSSPSTTSIRNWPPPCARSSSRSTRRRRSISSRRRLDRIPVKSNQHEYPVIPDRSRTLDFETNRIVRVFAHMPGAPQKVAGRAALFRQRPARSATGLCYTVRRLPRRRTAEERKYGPVVRLYRHRRVSLAGRALRPGGDSARRRTQRHALCTNRHLPAHLPVGESGADFRFLDDVGARLRCVAGPTRAAGAGR